MRTLPDNPFQSVDVIAQILKFARLRPLDQSQSRVLYATGPFDNPTFGNEGTTDGLEHLLEPQSDEHRQRVDKT